MIKLMDLLEAPRVPRKKGQHRGSSKHSDLYTDENPKGTIKGLKFATVKDAKASVSKINSSGKKHAHKIQAKDGKSTIDPDLVGKFAGVTGSIIVDGLKGEVTARCGDTVANDVTLNFVLDCINGNAIPSKEEYAKRILETR